jgi:two-component system chemotaxis response regulator CheY
MKKVVLTVDDSKTMRDMLRLALTDAGHTVVQADDGIHGVEVLKSTPCVDVIVTDINMPRMDGFGFIEHVRRDPKNHSTPILVLTTESEPAKRQRARDAGATGWIVKPFDPVKLVAAIRRVAP